MFKDTDSQEQPETLETGIRGRYSFELSLDQLAVKVDLHRTTVSRRIRRETGSTFREWSAIQREDEAKRLLADEGRSIKEIAFELNFASTSSFTRFFKRRTGVAPCQWRYKVATEKE